MFEVPCIRLHRKLREFGWKADRPSSFLCSRMTLNSLQMWVSWRITAQRHLQIGSGLSEGGSSCSRYGQHLPLGSSPWAPHKVLSSSCVRQGFVAAGTEPVSPHLPCSPLQRSRAHDFLWLLFLALSAVGSLLPSNLLSMQHLLLVFKDVRATWPRGFWSLSGELGRRLLSLEVAMNSGHFHCLFI